MIIKFKTMKAETHKQSIVEQFGGNDKMKLENMLCTLVDLSGGTIEKNYDYQDKPEPKENDYIELMKYNAGSIEKTIENIMNSNKIDLEKLDMIIEAFRFWEGWHHIKIIPVKFAVQIFNFYSEGKYGIEIDEKRDCQFITVNKK